MESGQCLKLPVTLLSRVFFKKILPKKIYKLFDVIVAGNNVKKGKPHPEPYLKAAKLLNLKIDECVVVENAPYGIESAKCAGMYCIAISTSLPREFLTRADVVIDDIGKISSLVCDIQR